MVGGYGIKGGNRLAVRGRRGLFCLWSCWGVRRGGWVDRGSKMLKGGSVINQFRRLTLMKSMIGVVYSVSET